MQSQDKSNKIKEIKTGTIANYSQAIKNELKENKISLGDNITLNFEEKEITGYLLPRNELGNSNNLIIKQSNGYNVGIEFKNGYQLTKNDEKINLEQFPFYSKKQNPKLPELSLIATGGTIASRVDYVTGGVKMASSPQELFALVPDLFQEVQFKTVEQLFQLGSEDIGGKQWGRIAKKVEKEINSGSAGIIVTHGTDMMGYSAAALSFMLTKLSKPVILTGSQRSSDRGSSDGSMNLIGAARYAIKGKCNRVLVCMHGSSESEICQLHLGTKVRKMHTSRRNAFKSINQEPIAQITKNGMITENQIPYKNGLKVNDDEETVAVTDFEEKIAQIKIFPHIPPEILDFYIDREYRGIIIEGTGLGHVPSFPPAEEASRSWLNVIKRAKEEGIFFRNDKSVSIWKSSSSCLSLFKNN